MAIQHTIEVGLSDATNSISNPDYVFNPHTSILTIIIHENTFCATNHLKIASIAKKI